MSKEKDHNKVNDTTSTYDDMAFEWELPIALMGGTIAMRNKGREYLPQEPKELDVSYSNRVARSFLYNGYADTVDKLSSKPFTQPITLTNSQKLDKRLQLIEKNCDKLGTNITGFFKSSLYNAIDRGLTYVICDFPSISETATLADENSIGARPYFIYLDPVQLIGWRTTTNPDGSVKVTQVRYFENTIVDSGRYGEKLVKIVKVWNIDSWEIWEPSEKNESVYVQTKKGKHSYPDGIPIKAFYTNKTGFMTGRPALIELAWTNLCHWQSSSDQRSILRFARCGTIFVKGMSNEEFTSQNFSIGPSQVLLASNEQAGMDIVEYSGSAIKAGAEDLEALEKKMEMLGMQPLVERSQNSTATGKAIDEGRSVTRIQTWIIDLQIFIHELYGMAAKWLNVELPDDFKVEVFADFIAELNNATEISAIETARQAGDLTQKTYLLELKRRGVLSSNIDIDEELAAIKLEGPSLGSLGLDDNDDPINKHTNDPTNDPTKIEE
jgi:hypothetical protein